MSRHPENKHERGNIKRRKGIARAIVLDNELTGKNINKLGDTRQPCTGVECGNPRRYFTGKDALTIQERRSIQV